MQWAYLFERFPSFTQTFCYREVVELERQGLAPWIFSIRRPSGEPAQNFLPEVAARVRYLPAESDLAEEFRWLKKCQRLPQHLCEDEMRSRGIRDKARLLEAGWLGPQMINMGIGHVHAHFAGLAARTAYWLREHFRIGYSFTAHANDVFCPPDPDLSLTLGDLMRTARYVVAVSDFGARTLRERFPESADKIFRVYNGIDLAAFPAAAPAHSKPLVVAVGRYIEKKGFGDLITACARLRDLGVEFQCRIVGEGPWQETLATQIAEMNLANFIELTGPKSINEVASLLAQARVFALPCVVEADGGMDNLPTVIAEAMAARLPVVSTTVAGVPEMVIVGKTGLLVPPHSPGKLAEALARLLAETSTAAAFGRAGHARARKLFALPVTGRAFKRLLLGQTGMHPGRAALWKDPALLWRPRKSKV